MNKKRPTFDAFRRKALKNPKVKAEYEALTEIFNIKREMIAIRKKAGITQAEIAGLMGTQKSNISRLESLNNDISPKLATIEDYARVLGYSVKVQFEPRAQ